MIDSRDAEEGSTIRRRRACPACQHRFTTYERLEEVPLMVVKSNGRREPFDQSKIVAGVAAACKGRPVPGDRIAQLAVGLEDTMRLHGPDVTTQDIGREVLERLRDLDEVAYLRFASVYKGFDGAADFQRELVLMKRPAPSAARTNPAAEDEAVVL